MTDLATTCGIPDELMAFVNDGFLAILDYDPANRYVEFHVPSLCSTDRRGRITTFSVCWRHPDFAGPLGMFDYRPGDGQPNFYVLEDTTDLGDELVDVETAEDLIAWLAELRESVVSFHSDRKPRVPIAR